MKPLALLPLMMLAASCATTLPTGEGLCLALAPLVDTHAQALLADGVPEAALISGARLVKGFDVGCRE